MDLSKFLQMLDSKSLYFARADKFEDRFEGSSGLASRQSEWDEHYLSYFRNAVRFSPENASSPPEEVVDREARRLLADLKGIVQFERRTTFISCWHSNSGESEALWRLYCPSGSAGLVVQTTAERIEDALNDPDIELGRVQYIDFRKSFPGFYDRIFWKRKSLSHEAEVRAVWKNRNANNITGINKTVDIEKLCEQIILSPFAPSWLHNLIDSLTKMYGYNLKVGNSELEGEPFF